MPTTLPNGLYKLAFETKAGAEYGVAYLQDGRIRGGDGGSVYVGKFQQEGALFSAEMSITQHRYIPGAIPALGLHNVLVELHGLVEENGVVRVQGSSPESSVVRFTARLSQIAD